MPSAVCDLTAAPLAPPAFNAEFYRDRLLETFGIPLLEGLVGFC